MLNLPKVKKDSSVSTVSRKIKNIVAAVLAVGTLAVAGAPAAAHAVSGTAAVQPSVSPVTVEAPLLLMQNNRLNGESWHSSHGSHASHASHASHFSSRW